MKEKILQALITAGIAAHDADALPETMAYPCVVIWDTGVRAMGKTTGMREICASVWARESVQAMALAAKVRTAVQPLNTLREVESEDEGHWDSVMEAVCYEMRFRMLCGR